MPSPALLPAITPAHRARATRCYVTVHHKKKLDHFDQLEITDNFRIDKMRAT